MPIWMIGALGTWTVSALDPPATGTSVRAPRYGLTMFVRVLGVLVLSAVACSCSADESADASGLEADFEYSVAYENAGPTSCPARAVHLSDTSVGSPTSWKWNFPDGSTSTERAPTIAPVPGSMSGVVSEVTLTVSDDDRRDTVTKRIEIPVC